MEKPKQLPSGKWRQRVTGPDGKRHSVTEATERKTAKAAALLLAELIATAEKAEETQARTLTRFDLFAESWLQTRRPGEPGGYAVTSYRKRLHHLATLNRTFGEHHVEDITPAMIRTWWNTLSDTPSQRHTLFWFLHAIFEVALDDELIHRNPARVRGASTKAAKTRPTFTDADVEKVYAAATDDQTRAMLAVLRGTALRVGELVALDWSDISFLESKLSVTKHSTAYGIQPGTKTGPDHCRTIALPQWVQDVLEGLLKGTDGEGPIFLHSKGGRLSVDGAERIFRTLRAAAGLDHMHLHDLRHIALTSYARQPGVTLADLKAFGGHLSDSVAMGYQHSDDERATQHAATSMVPRWVKA